VIRSFDSFAPKLFSEYRVGAGGGGYLLKLKALIGVASCHHRVTDRSQNILIHLHLVNTRITYNIDQQSRM
jgi:hypothetical protein